MQDWFHNAASTRTHHRLYHTKDILFIVHAFIKATMNLSHHMIYRPFWLNRIQFFYLIKNTFSIHISQHQRVNTQLLIDMIGQFLLSPSFSLHLYLSILLLFGKIWSKKLFFSICFPSLETVLTRKKRFQKHNRLDDFHSDWMKSIEIQSYLYPIENSYKKDPDWHWWW